MVGMLQQQWRCGWPPLAFSSSYTRRSPLFLPRAFGHGDDNLCAGERWVSGSGPDSFRRLPSFCADSSTHFQHPWLNVSRLPCLPSLCSIRQPTLETADTSCKGHGEGPLARTSKCMPYVLLGFGAFLACEQPALADLVRGGGGGSTGLWEGVTVREIMKSGWAGMMAGCLHTLTGLDHLAALAPLCIGRPKLESAMVGALWGCGHDAGQIIFGLVFLLLRGKLKMELLQVWASRVIGFTLLAIGVVGLKEAQEVPVSVMAGESSGGGTSVSPPIAEEESRRANHRLRTFGTGVVYGLQPDALIMILPALALPSRLAGAAYLGMFLFGTIIAMSSYTAFIGSCGQALQNRLPWITQRLSMISSVVAIIFGLGILLGEFFGISFIN